MSRRAVAIAAAAIVALVFLIAFFVGRRSQTPEGLQPESSEIPLETLDIEGDELRLRLLFPGARGRLYFEERLVPPPSRRVDLVRLAVTELFAGPSDPDLVAPFPPDVTVADVLLSEEGVAYIDLAAPHLAGPPPSGSLTELLEIYSIVDTVLLNAPDVRGVVLLWNGAQQATFAGHLDTSRPLTLKRDLIAGGV